MSNRSRQFVAVLMALWLPLFTGSALASAVAMQMPAGACHEMVMGESDESPSLDGHHPQHEEMADSQDAQGAPHHSCGVCHFACTGFMNVAISPSLPAPHSAQSITPYLVSYCSVTFAPLLPPPLARA